MCGILLENEVESRDKRKGIIVTELRLTFEIPVALRQLTSVKDKAQLTSSIHSCRDHGRA